MKCSNRTYTCTQKNILIKQSTSIQRPDNPECLKKINILLVQHWNALIERLYCYIRNLFLKGIWKFVQVSRLLAWCAYLAMASTLPYMHVFQKNGVKFVNEFFFMKKGSSGKNLDIILFAYLIGAQISLQWTKGYINYGNLLTSCRNYCTRPIFLHRFCLAIRIWWRRVILGKTYPVIDAPVHGKHDGTSYKSVWHSIRKLCPLL